MRSPRDLWLSQGICCCSSHAPGAPCSVVCSAGSALAFPGAPVFFLELSPLHTDQTWCCLSSVVRSAHICRTGRNDIKTYHPTPSGMTCQEAVYLHVPGLAMCRQTGADWAGKAPEKWFNPVVTHSHCQGGSSALHCVPWDCWQLPRLLPLLQWWSLPSWLAEYGFHTFQRQPSCLGEIRCHLRQDFKNGPWTKPRNSYQMVQDDLSVVTPLLPLLRTPSPIPPLFSTSHALSPLWQPWRSQTSKHPLGIAAASLNQGVLWQFSTDSKHPGLTGSFPWGSCATGVCSSGHAAALLQNKAAGTSDVQWNGIPRREPSVKLISMSEEKSWMKSFPASPTKTAHQLLQWI